MPPTSGTADRRGTRATVSGGTHVPHPDRSLRRTVQLHASATGLLTARWPDARRTQRRASWRPASRCGNHSRSRARAADTSECAAAADRPKSRPRSSHTGRSTAAQRAIIVTVAADSVAISRAHANPPSDRMTVAPSRSWSLGTGGEARPRSGLVGRAWRSSVNRVLRLATRYGHGSASPSRQPAGTAGVNGGALAQRRPASIVISLRARRAAGGPRSATAAPRAGACSGNARTSVRSPAARCRGTGRP